MKEKIAIIVQRYGLQINGGAEAHARMIAEKLSAQYEVIVLTSCALEYHTWSQQLSPGENFEGNIRVVRFEHGQRISKKEEHYLNRKLRERHLPQKFYRWLGKPSWWFKLFPHAKVTDEDQSRWLQAQGPFIPKLLPYLNEHQHEYAACIFFTAVYYPAAAGILAVPSKSILVPLMHDEPAAYFPIFQEVMASARWLLFNTLAEQRFCEKLFPIEHSNKRVVAVGINIPDPSINKDIPANFDITKPYIVYIGRIDTFKGCDTLVE